MQHATSITRDLRSELDRLGRETEVYRARAAEAETQSVRQADELSQQRRGREEVMKRLLDLQRERGELEAAVSGKQAALEQIEDRLQDYERLETEYRTARSELEKFNQAEERGLSARADDSRQAASSDSDFEPGTRPLTVEELAEVRARIYNKQSEYLKGGYGDAVLRRELADLHFNLAVVYSHNRDWESAVREYNNTLLLNADDADAHFNLAVVLAKHFGREEEALQHYQEYLRLNPGADDAPRVKGWILDKQIESKFRE